MVNLSRSLVLGETKKKLEQLLQAADASPSFRAQLTSDPKKAIEGFLGLNLPDGITVNVIEDSTDSLTIVLPPKVSKNIGAPGAIINLDQIGDVVGAAYASIIECPSIG